VEQKRKNNSIFFKTQSIGSRRCFFYFELVSESLSLFQNHNPKTLPTPYSLLNTANYFLNLIPLFTSSLFAKTVFSKQPQELLWSLWVSKKKSLFATQGLPLPSRVQRTPNQNRQ
jgi:hypothetical protein